MNFNNIYVFDFQIKSFLFSLLISVITILTPIKAFLIICSLFVGADTVFGIYTTIKLNGLKSFRSNLLFNVVVKTFFYMGAIVLAYLIDKHIFEGSIMGVNLLITKAITLLWCYIELKSLNQTSMKLGNKSLWVLVKDMFNKGKEFKKDLGDIINNNDNQEIEE
ncbi:phage holin family protein [Flavobacterium capsici]|uniref:Phage holin family protein n=1 Tax=Flavobacterium capsici TaxID=3075618 RepID=A0AA96J509_9FLAO|nr:MULTISPECIES: phage holin family protein [unclassified Flavobacterium]WNM18616.1 phage holin family protein [Flavobacterium sp. PMR2A8]WNM22667.1 phage holin family protein [Flavobacterium sp. PMTSA4]